MKIYNQRNLYLRENRITFLLLNLFLYNRFYGNSNQDLLGDFS